MARPRVISQEAILDAAERVVARDGAAQLTLEAVGVEAGICKASVVYDYKTKQSLINAVVDRRVQAERQLLHDKIAQFEGTPDATLLGMIEVARDAIDDETFAVSMHLAATVAQEQSVRADIQNLLNDKMRDVVANSPSPRSALILFLAVQGFRSMEYLGLHRWSEEERVKIMSDITSLIGVKVPDRP